MSWIKEISEESRSSHQEQMMLQILEEIKQLRKENSELRRQLKESQEQEESSNGFIYILREIRKVLVKALIMTVDLAVRSSIFAV